MDNETSARQVAWLGQITAAELSREPHVAQHGAILLCTAGEATISVDYKEWRLSTGSVVIIFPGDVTAVMSATAEFAATALRYDSSILREASLQIERAVYDRLRKDRCRDGNSSATRIVSAMLTLLDAYASSAVGTGTADVLPLRADLPDVHRQMFSTIVMYQLKSFFLGFYAHVSRHGGVTAAVSRADELFNDFMDALEANYRTAHSAAFYADALNITPKYLNRIVKGVTGHTAKTVIDQYVIMQLKHSLRSGRLSVKQISAGFGFADESFFCRYFRRHTGLTPQQFRKALTADTVQRR